MPKIKALIKEISEAYASYVNLTEEFHSPQDNRERMKGYRPISSHRDAIQSLIRSLIPNEHKVYALRGSYGTGKSHLFLMLANFLGSTPDSPEIQQFLVNYAEKDQEGAQKMKNLRGDGRYLVALCRYGVGDNFESILLRAIKDACEREDFEGLENTHYHEALRRLDEWKTAHEQGKPTGHMYDLFLDTLAEQYPGTTLSALREGLEKFEYAHLEMFKAIFEFMTGGDFTPDRGNLIDILKEFASDKAFKERFKGLVFFYDEFDEILKKGNLEVSRFQAFAETCRHAGPDLQPILFYANIHKPLQGYARAFSQEDFQVVRARLKEVQLVTQGIEDIIAAIVIPDQESELWEDKVASRNQTFIKLVNESRQAQVFPWRTGHEFRERIIEDLYPMHPMATHCLVQLSKEAGSNARSLFTFFTQTEEDGCYRDFIASTEIESDGRLTFYTVDTLFLYFRHQLSADNVEPREEVRNAIQDYHASYRQARTVPGFQFEADLDPLIDRILKTILIYKISNVTCNLDNLTFGLYVTDEEEQRIRGRLNKLKEQKVLFESQHGIYEFRQSDIRDFQSEIELYKSDPDNLPEDFAQEVVQIHSLERGQRWLEPKEYNEVFYEDKRLTREFIRPIDLAMETFSLYYEEMINIERWKDKYEGVALYVLCENMEEIKTARKNIKENDYKNIIIGIPQEPIPVREALMDLKAVNDLRRRPDMQDLSIPEQSRLDDLRGNETEGILGRFLELRNRYFEGRRMVWFGKKGQVITSQPEHSYEPADQIISSIYQKRNRIAHGTDFNKIHVSKTGSSNTQLHDAVKELLDVSRDVKIDTSYGDNRGEIRYLKRCFADVDALSQIGVAEGTKRYYRVEVDADKYQNKLPSLTDMVQEIDTLEPGDSINIQTLIDSYQAPPYGQGPISLSLYLAYAIRRFGDSLSLKKDPNDIGSIGDCPPDMIYDLIDGNYPNAVFEKRRITENEKEFIVGVYDLFSPLGGTVSDRVMLMDAHTAFKDWWGSLTLLAKNPDIYEKESVQRFLTTVKDDLQDPAHRFITNSLQTIYGYSPNDAITETSWVEILDGLRKDKERIETRPNEYKKEVLQKIFSLEFFDMEEGGLVLGDYKSALEEWFRALDDSQRDPLAEWHSEASRALIRNVSQFSDIQELMLETIPAEYGFSLGPVDSWTIDKSDDYISKMENALRRIAENEITVEPPEYSFMGDVVTESGGEYHKSITYRGELKLGVKPSSDSKCGYLTTNGDDPRKSESQREKFEEPFSESIHQSNAKVKFCSQSENGKFGRVITLDFINKDQEYVIRPYQTLPIGEAAPHQFPNDAHSLKVSIVSLVKNLMEHADVPKEEVKKVLKDLLSSL